MARFRRRLRRPRRFSKRRMRRSRRMRRRTRRMRRRSKAFTVGFHRDFEVNLCSAIPSVSNIAGSSVGVPADNYCTWSIPVVPPELLYPLGNNLLGYWKNDVALSTRNIGTAQTYGGEPMITDLPTCISSQNLFGNLNCVALSNLMTKYRIAYCTATFTIPENTNGEKNHHLYLEWTHLPLAQPCKPDSLWGFIASSASGYKDSYGFNWVCRPIDIAEACSIPGKGSYKHKWHRAQLTSNAPVTIAWRPRHSAISADRTYYVDNKGNNSNQVSHQDEFADKDRFVRSYLPVLKHAENVTRNDDQVWLGPVVRLVDADLPINSTIDNALRLGKYHIRCSFSLKLKLKGMKAADPLFPSWNPSIPS
ncbi:putative capsid protein [Dromedary stool-associated circular ssDNA virus]|uniref:putative capsid protein n=1 Tax=Dromedary stool-associated circular ssDNA virus TaxID=1574422 RepID=UPI000540981A|nr:putative capsid protein [Dromedary stool-associated circular ssDNA virus]AIY31231.1 putative capsid protein [Dromedary stool-associated circular ssDNA virus]